MDILPINSAFEQRTLYSLNWHIVMIVTTMTVKINSDDRDAIVSDDYTYGDEEFNHLIPNMLAIWMTSQRRNAWVQLRSDMASQRRVGIQLARGNSSNI